MKEKNTIMVREDLFYDQLQTPIGWLGVRANRQYLLAVAFVQESNEVRSNHICQLAVVQLAEYFNKQRQTFDLPLEKETVAKGSDFQQQVWRALTTIEYGRTCSYQDIANKINNPKAVRAVGSANGRNPLTIVVPCHRVIGKNGHLAGYASGLRRKQWLLEHETDY